MPYVQAENPKELNIRQLAFIDELLADPQRNARQAAKRAGYAEKSAAVQGHLLMHDNRVKAIIATRESERLKSARMSADEVAAHIAELAKADPRDLMEYWRGACRHCHGFEFKYQRTPQEYRNALAVHAAARAKAGNPDPLGFDLDPLGGLGFTPNKPPHPDCPECYGHGVGYEIIKDSRTLPPGAARLYAGLKVTKEGIEIKTRSQDKALELAARNTGVVRDTVKVDATVKGAAAVVALTTTDPAEAARQYQALMNAPVSS
jgi:phage terminase small subunit